MQKGENQIAFYGIIKMSSLFFIAVSLVWKLGHAAVPQLPL